MFGWNWCGSQSASPQLASLLSPCLAVQVPFTALSYVIVPNVARDSSKQDYGQSWYRYGLYWRLCVYIGICKKALGSWMGVGGEGGERMVRGELWAQWVCHMVISGGDILACGLPARGDVR